MTPAEVVVDVFGGIVPVARILGVNRSTVWRWVQPFPAGNGTGVVPARYQQPLLKAAEVYGKTLTFAHLLVGEPGVIRHSADRKPARV